MRYVLKKLGWTLCRNIDEAASIVSVNRVCQWNFCARFSGNQLRGQVFGGDLLGSFHHELQRFV